MSCRTCKHWGAPVSSRYDYPVRDWDHPDYAGDEDEKPPDDKHQHRVCELIDLGDPKQYADPPKAFTMDASSYCAALWTAPDFSCCLFEAK